MVLKHKFFRINLKTMIEEQLTSQVGAVFTFPIFINNKTQLAFLETSSSPVTDIYTCNLDGSDFNNNL